MNTVKHNIFRKNIGILLIICAISVIIIPAQSQVNAEQVINIGRNVLSMEDYMLSIQYFNQAIKAKPYLSEPYFYRGLAKLYLEDFKGAEEDCSFAIERNKFKIEAYKVRGFARQQMGCDSLAINDYNAGLRYAPLDKYFLFYKGVAQTSLGNYSGADSTFTTLLKAFPGFEDGYTARANLNLAKKDTVKALYDISRAIEISRRNAQPYLLRAEIYSSRADWDKAISDMDEAIKLKPREDNFYVNRAYLRYNTGDYFGAMSDYNYALELEPQNTAARFNRALLQYEVKDLQKAAEDFSEVLSNDPSNFHARYNRGLVYMELSKNKEAFDDFHTIASKYPRFYPVYYAMAQIKQSSGDLRGAGEYIRKADEMVKRYVKNPEANPLDRPTIAAGTANTSGSNYTEGESEIEVMNRFNQLVTVASHNQTELSYNEKIKGRVQDRDVKVELEKFYLISFYNNTSGTLNNMSNYFRELDELNQNHWLAYNIYISNNTPAPSSEEYINKLFSLVENFDNIMTTSNVRPIDWLGRGVALASLKNYQAAIADLDTAISLNNHFTVAYMARAGVLYSLAAVASDSHTEEDTEEIVAAKKNIDMQRVMSDLDNALNLNPRLIYAWFNKGNLYYEFHDYTSAINCYTRAIEINPTFGEAFFNRGLVYLSMGDKQRGISDLSKAGELGILPSYNVLKRMK